VIEAIYKLYIVLGEILNQNFDFVENGSVFIRNKQLSKVLQISMSILVTDVISLMNVIEMAFMPFTKE
jgi:hypothetical protein